MDDSENKYWNAAFKNGQDYRLFSDELLKKVIDEVGVPSTLLDLGCGTGDLMRKLEKYNVSTTGLDFSDEAIKIAQSRGTKGKLIQANLDSINDVSLSQKFDWITLKLVLAFVKEKHSLLEWCKSMLTPAGVVIINTPISSSENPCLKPGIEINNEAIFKLLVAQFGDVKIVDEDRTPIGLINTYICRV
jgi:2-polyprenyl-3-methyl-5-hydroxy-6-metoxy-1,4-benzoquinol methylase